ncbi:MAG: serine/threonine protein kinase [Myxococcales bacterium]|nr:serine/threonine protein kinase [Myxococcales bacterium]
MSLEPGTLVATHYRVLRQLGKGGMGEVFAAENLRTGRHVAIKLLRAEAKQKLTAIERSRREARAAGAIRSPFVTEVYDVEDDPEHGIVLVFELLEGESLVERLKRTGPIPFPEVWTTVEAVWAGLADAHAAGIIHRDLKPSNVFLDYSSGTVAVKIVDFGISKLPRALSGDSLTQAGQSLGTFSFMPPEQVGKAKSVDQRADIYACATLVFQSLTGRLPFAAKNSVAMMELKLKHDARSMSEASGAVFDERLEAFVRKGLARDPGDRFQTALEALSEWRRLRPEGAPSLTNAWVPPVERSERNGLPGDASPRRSKAAAQNDAAPSTFLPSSTIPVPQYDAVVIEHVDSSGRRPVKRAGSGTHPMTSVDSPPASAPPEVSFATSATPAQDSGQSSANARALSIAAAEFPTVGGAPASAHPLAISATDSLDSRTTVRRGASTALRKRPPEWAARLRVILLGAALMLFGFGCVVAIMKYLR